MADFQNHPAAGTESLDRAGNLVRGDATVLVDLVGQLPGPFPAGTPASEKLAET